MKLTGFLTAAALVATAGTAIARDQIRIVGSSTVFPFSTAVAEQFGRATDFATPVVESTGSGGGMKLFCAGVGTEHPDITNASRRMKAKEFKLCMENGVTDITESVVGFDGIVVSNAIDAPAFDLTVGQLWTALAANGPLPTMWNEVDPALPAAKIEVLGPPPSSGTRDAFEELVMEEGCEMAGGNCDEIEIRADGAWVDAGENDNLMVSKLASNPAAVAVFGFSFLDQNADSIKGANIGGVEPTFENIASGAYPVSRSLYYYVKKAHVGVVPGIHEYATEFATPGAAGIDGYLVDKGLIPLPDAEFAANADAIANLTNMDGSVLK